MRMSTKNYKVPANRQQLSLFADRLDDHLPQEHVVRAIDAYVETLDLTALEAHRYKSDSMRGQPAYHPKSLLALYLYGYLNGIRSSRKLEKECQRNIEVIWLMKHQKPSYKTIADFRKDHAQLLIKLNRNFILLCRQLALIGQELVAIDGSHFHGNASKQSILTKTRLQKQIQSIEAKIQTYHEQAAQTDREEKTPPETSISIESLHEKLSELTTMMSELEASPDRQVSQTDPDARLLSKGGDKVAGYNVQAAVEATNQLLVASAVTNEPNDLHQLSSIAKQAKEQLEADSLEVVADAGYYESKNLAECEAAKITVFVPVPKTGGAKSAGFEAMDFKYDAEQKHYSCPAGALLLPLGKGHLHNGKKRQMFKASEEDCKSCPHRTKCLTEKSTFRKIYRNEYQDAMDHHVKRMRTPESKQKIKQRSGLIEHVFGTLKLRAGWQHFLVRGFEKVNGEWSLMALAYNFTRVLNIIGLEAFMAYCQRAIEDIAIFLRFFISQSWHSMQINPICLTYRAKSDNFKNRTHRERNLLKLNSFTVSQLRNEGQY